MTSAMATTELDPVFVKALKLMRSKSKDSTDLLKKMLDDVIAARRPEGKRDDDHEPKSFSKLSFKKEKEDQARKRESEKRTLEKLQQDIVDLTAPAKKQKLDHSEREYEREKSRDKDRKSQDERSDRKEKDSERKEKDRKKMMVIESSSESESESTDDEKNAAPKVDDEFALDLGDLACVVCKQMDVTSGNNLVECQDCHSLYHQECHRPPVTEDINDPRFVWYCHRCEKNMKRMANKSSKSRSSSSLSSKDVMKSSKSEPPGLVQPFRRMEPTKPTSSKESSSSSGSRPLGGLASLAANLNTKDSSKTVKESSLFAAALTGSTDVPMKTSKSSSSKSDSSKSSSGSKDSHKSGSSSSKSSSSQKSSSSSSSKSSSLMSADKRLQMMKKKAAAKVHDKRK